MLLLTLQPTMRLAYTAQLKTLFALSNLWMVRKKLMVMGKQLRLGIAEIAQEAANGAIKQPEYSPSGRDCAVNSS